MQINSTLKIKKGLSAALVLAGFTCLLGMTSAFAVDAIPNAKVYKNGDTYAIGAVVSHNGFYYRCEGVRAAFCGNAAFEPGNANLNWQAGVWTLIGPAPASTLPPAVEVVNPDLVEPYVAGKNYKEGDIVSNRGFFYKCLPFPGSGFCPDKNFEPGNSVGWVQAWQKLGKAPSVENLEQRPEIAFTFGEAWANGSTASVKFAFGEDLRTMVITYPPNTITDLTAAWGADAVVTRSIEADVVTLTKKKDVNFAVTQVGFNLVLKPNESFKNLAAASAKFNDMTAQVINRGVEAAPGATPPVLPSGFDPFPKIVNENDLSVFTASKNTNKTFKMPTYLDEDGKEVPYLLGGYFTDWGIYKGYTPNQLPVNNINFVQVSFAAICGEGTEMNWFGNESATDEAKGKINILCKGKPVGTMILPDTWAHYGKKDMNLPEWEGGWNKVAYQVPGYARKYNPFVAHTKNFYGFGAKELFHDDGLDFAWGLKADFSHYNQVLNRHGRNFNMLLSIGGWTLSDPFPVIANNVNYRANFVNSVVAYLQENEHITGIDLDWEFIGVDGAKIGLMSAKDSNNYTKLLHELRQGLNGLTAKNGIQYKMTAAMGTAPKHLSKVNWKPVVIDGHTFPGVGEMLDHIFLMSYDYYGAWDGKVGHHSALFNNGNLEGHSIDSAVQFLKAQGINSRKMIVGYAGYGRIWANAKSSPENARGQYTFPNQANAVAPGNIGTIEAANVAWRHIRETAFDDNGVLKPGYQFVRDEKAMAEHLVATNPNDPNLNVVVTLDTPWSVQKKLEYVKANNLGGAFTWSLDNDNGDLLNAAHAGLGSTVLSSSMHPNARENSMLLYRSKEATYCSNPHVVGQYAMEVIQNTLTDVFTLGLKSIADGLQSGANLLSAALANEKTLADLTDAEWNQYFQTLQNLKRKDGKAVTLDPSKLSKTGILNAASDFGKNASFKAVDVLFSPPMLVGVGLSVSQDFIWDAITPPRADYCGRITRGTLDPWQQLGKDIPSLKDNFKYNN